MHVHTRASRVCQSSRRVQHKRESRRGSGAHMSHGLSSSRPVCSRSLLASALSLPLEHAVHMLSIVRSAMQYVECIAVYLFVSQKATGLPDWRKGSEAQASDDTAQKARPRRHTGGTVRFSRTLWILLHTCLCLYIFLSAERSAARIASGLRHLRCARCRAGHAHAWLATATAASRSLRWLINFTSSDGHRRPPATLALRIAAHI